MTDILTLRLDEASQKSFDAQRKTYFPPERNLIAAHLTLFHTLPPSDRVRQAIASGSQQPPFRLQVSGLRSLGRGVAYVLASDRLLCLHADLARQFREYLSPEDRQPFQPHAVVQNKVASEAAKTLLQHLR